MNNTPISPENYGIFGVASITPNVVLADPHKNARNILEELRKPQIKDARFVVFPELSLTGYSCGDLFFQSSLIDGAEQALEEILQESKEDNRLIAVGLPIVFKGRLYNCAAALCNGKVLGVVPKINIPNYQEFYEKRWFASGENIRNNYLSILNETVPFGANLLFEHLGVKVGIEICEDLWVPVPPSSVMCGSGAELILNLSATDDNVGKYDYIRNLVSSQSGRCRCAYAYSSAGWGESSTDLVFSGLNIIGFDGDILSESSRFIRNDSYAVATIDIERLRKERLKHSTFFPSSVSSEYVIINTEKKIEGDRLFPEIKVNPHPFVPSNEKIRHEVCEEIVQIQSWGLAKRMATIGNKNLVVGISGGLDSTLALLVAYHSFKSMSLDPKGIVAVTMPGDATSKRTRTNALKLMKILGVSYFEISVQEAVKLHFRDINHDPEVYDAVYENSQARERTQILMDLANKYNGLVLGTGDMSELALGWCTYNGDHMSMYNVNAGVPKTLVKYLVKWFADTTTEQNLKIVLEDIIDTPISPELIPSSEEEISQKTEDIVGPYELHDFFLYHVVRNGFTPSKIFFLACKAFGGRYNEEELKKWFFNFYKRFFSQQFKRSCMPDGPKIGSVCLSPRGDWRMPSDATVALWAEEIKQL